MAAKGMQLLGYETKTTYDDLKIRWLWVKGPWSSQQLSRTGVSYLQSAALGDFSKPASLLSLDRNTPEK